MDITKYAVAYGHHPRALGPVWVITRDGQYVGHASSEDGAWESVDMAAVFGYFDPTEQRQRDAMRARRDAIVSARATWRAQSLAAQ